VAVPEFFNTIEQTGLSRWIRETESVFGFYFILLFHNFGLAMLVCSSAIIDLRLLGVAPQVPVKSLKPLFTIMLWGFVLSVLTGTLLLYAYPTKALTNPMFYAKLSVIALAVITMYRMKTRVFDNADLSEADMIESGKTMAKWSIAFWIASITAGRLLAYTYKYIYYGFTGTGAAVFHIHI
jgi:hypothetical protein